MDSTTLDRPRPPGLRRHDEGVSQVVMAWQMRLLAPRAFPHIALRDKPGLLRPFLSVTARDCHLLWRHVSEQMHTCATPSVRGTF